MLFFQTAFNNQIYMRICVFQNLELQLYNTIKMDLLQNLKKFSLLTDKAKKII